MSGKLMVVDQQQLMSIICMNQQNNFNQFKVLVLDDEVIEGPNFIQGSILLPPPSALFALVDNNDTSLFAATYDSYLRSPEVDAFITLLATALYKGMDILMFLNNSDPSMFLGFLGGFLMNCHGLIINSPTGESINPAVIPSLLNKMCAYGYITQEEYNSNFVQNDNSPFKRVIR